MRHAALLRSTALVLGGALASFSLSACNKAATPTQASSPVALTDATGGAVAPGASLAAAPAGALAPVATPPPAPVAEAPPAAALAPAPQAAIATPPPPAQQYQYVDQAASMSAAFADSPPDYTVDYQGTRPWIWRANNGAYRIVEATPGGERYFYFMPGATTPFLVRDPSHTYAYDQGRLVVVYDAGGTALAPSLAARQAAMAGRYLARARALYVAAAREKHQAAYAANWQSRRASVLAQQQQWSAQQQRNQAWRAWHNQHAVSDQALLDRERAQRQAYAAQLAIAPTHRARADQAVKDGELGAKATAPSRGARTDQAPPAPARGRENAPPVRPPAPAPEQSQRLAQRRADQVEVDAARQNLARAKAQTVNGDPSSKARTMDAARNRLKLALRKQAAEATQR